MSIDFIGIDDFAIEEIDVLLVDDPDFEDLVEWIATLKWGMQKKLMLKTER